MDQEPVAIDVAEAVVDSFEAVEVDEEHDTAQAGSRRVGKCRAEMLGQEEAVG